MTRYDYSAISAATVRQATDDGLAEAERLIAAVVTRRGPRTFENTLIPLSDAVAAVSTADGRGGRIGHVHPDAAVRAAATEALERTGKWRNELLERDDVARAVREYAATGEAAQLAGGRRRVLDLWLRDLRRAGHELDPEARGEVARLRARITELTVVFEDRLRDWNETIELGPGDLEGLSPTLVGQLADGATPGSKSLPIVWSTLQQFLAQSSRRDLREAALRRWLSRAAGENRPIVDELVALRRRIAALMGAPSWSQFANEARMSGGADAVAAFLDRVLPPLQALAADERRAMRAVLEAEGVDGEVLAWDWNWCNERQRRSIGLDTSALSSYLPLDAVLDGLFGVAREVFGIEVARDRAARAWHPDVRLVVLRDAATGEHLADCYLDLLAREGKSPGAWQDQLEPAAWRPGSPHTPKVLMLVTNFTPAPGGQPLLEQGDVELLFHEFGHALESAVERVEMHFVAWSWLELDFIEAPSQIMEHWTWEPAVLGRFARHHETGEPPPDDLLDNLPAIRRLNVATSALWYAFRAVMDQLLHGPEPVDSGDAYREAFAVTGFPFPEGTYLPASFAHLDNYDAGYYGYLWAQVFGDDMFSAFRQGGLLSGEVGRRYRTEVLEPTWTVPGRERVRNFLGREPSELAFLDRLGIGGQEIDAGG